VTRKLGLALTNLALNKYFQMFVNIPFIKNLLEKFSEEEVGADVEITSFSGVLTVSSFLKISIFNFNILAQHSSTTK